MKSAKPTFLSIVMVFAIAFGLDAAIAAVLGFVFPGALAFWQWFAITILFFGVFNSLKPKS